MGPGVRKMPELVRTDSPSRSRFSVGPSWLRHLSNARPILRQVGGSVSLSLLVWIVGGVLSLLGALTYAELAAANPEAGGLYCYIRDGFGRLSAFSLRLVSFSR